MTAAYGKWQWGVGTYSASIDLAGHMPTVFTFSATLANPNPLAGDMPVVVTIGDMSASLALNLTGDLAPQIDISGLLAGVVLVGGDLPVDVTLAAQMGSGPLWGPIGPCAPVDWEESRLCNG